MLKPYQSGSKHCVDLLRGFFAGRWALVHCQLQKAVCLLFRLHALAKRNLCRTTIRLYLSVICHHHIGSGRDDLGIMSISHLEYIVRS